MDANEKINKAQNEHKDDYTNTNENNCNIHHLTDHLDTKILIR